MIKFVYENNSVNVSKDFIENKMKDINGEFVKVYLYAMYVSQSGIECTYLDIAKKLGLLESEVKRAFDVFFELGILKKEEENTQQNQQIKRQSILENGELSDFCILAEATINKPLKQREIETLYWIYTNLNLKPEVILMAIEYCVAENNTDMKAIEKLAINWDKQGITTIQKAQQFLDEQYKRKEIVKKMAEMLEIADMNEQRESFIISWYYDMNVSEELIAFAHECCVSQINKVSFHYMNTIIKNWCNKGITTVEAAKKDNKEFKSKLKGKSNLQSDNGEYDDLALLTQRN